MSLVKIAAKILEENPEIGPLEALKRAKAQRPPSNVGKRTEAEKEILRARREWRKKVKEDILASVRKTSVDVTVAPVQGGCEIGCRIGKDLVGSSFVPIEPIYTYPARIRAEIV